MKNKMLTVYLQLIGTIVAIVFFFMYFLSSTKYLIHLQFTVAILFILMGINNKYYYKRDNFTVLYFVFGTLIFIYTILKIIGVV